MVQDDDDDEGWEWVHTTPLHHKPEDEEDVDDDDDDFFPKADDASAELLTNITQFSENLSSTASSPILKHSHSVRVMAKEHFSALDAMHHSASEWIEPQLVFSKQHGPHFEGFEIYKVVTHLQNLPKAKEALLSVISDGVVFDAVISNRAFQELASEHKDSDFGFEALDSNSACTSSLFYKHGKKAYKLLRQKLTKALDILLSLLGRDTLERNAIDELDATVKPIIALVAILVFVVLSKRSNEGICLTHVV